MRLFVEKLRGPASTRPRLRLSKGETKQKGNNPISTYPVDRKTSYASFEAVDNKNKNDGSYDGINN